MDNLKLTHSIYTWEKPKSPFQEQIPVTEEEDSLQDSCLLGLVFTHKLSEISSHSFHSLTAARQIYQGTIEKLRTPETWHSLSPQEGYNFI